MKEFTLELWKLPWCNWKTVRVRELGIWHGFICWEGVSKIYPEAADLLNKGYAVRIKCSLEGVE